MSKSEKAIQNEVLMGVTRLGGAMFWREQSAKAWVGRLVSYENGRVVLERAQPIIAGVPGIADIMGVYGGTAHALEVKTETGTQEDSQKKFQKVFESVGGRYSIVRSKEEALEFLRASVN